MRESRCHLVFISRGDLCTSLLMVQALVKRACPGPWEIKAEGRVPSVVYDSRVAVPGQPRVYVMERTKEGFSQLEHLGSQFDADVGSTVILDNSWDNWGLDNVIVVPKWEAMCDGEGSYRFPEEDDNEWEQLRAYLFDILDGPKQSIPAFLKNRPCMAFRREQLSI